MLENLPNKIIGYLLLAVGLLGIILPSYSVYQVYTKRAKPVNVFLLDSIKLDFGKFTPDAPANAALTQDLVPADVLNAPLNYAAHLMLMGFIASASFKIASLGIMLVRPIKVKLKEEKEVLTSTNSSDKGTL
jgi:hypothetical protein